MTSAACATSDRSIKSLKCSLKTAYIEFEGEGVVTAADIQVDQDIEIMNPCYLNIGFIKIKH